MSRYCCPKCDSENTQSFEVAYDAFGTGSYSVSSYTDSNGVTRVSGGGSYRLRPDLAPPRFMPEPTPPGFFSYLWRTGLLTVAYTVVLCLVAMFFIDLSLKSVGYIAACIFVWAVKKAIKDERSDYERRVEYYYGDYANLVDKYKRSYICLRCGHRFVVPNRETARNFELKKAPNCETVNDKSSAPEPVAKSNSNKLITALIVVAVAVGAFFYFNKGGLAEYPQNCRVAVEQMQKIRTPILLISRLTGDIRNDTDKNAVKQIREATEALAEIEKKLSSEKAKEGYTKQQPEIMKLIKDYQQIGKMSVQLISRSDSAPDNEELLELAHSITELAEQIKTNDDIIWRGLSLKQFDETLPMYMEKAETAGNNRSQEVITVVQKLQQTENDKQLQKKGLLWLTESVRLEGATLFVDGSFMNSHEMTATGVKNGTFEIAMVDNQGKTISKQTMKIDTIRFDRKVTPGGYYETTLEFADAIQHVGGIASAVITPKEINWSAIKQ